MDTFVFIVHCIVVAFVYPKQCSEYMHFVGVPR
jgi:hypothetical protein